MGNSYCLSPDKKTVQNELTVINIQEENLEEKKLQTTSNQNANSLVDKKNNKNETHSNLTNLTNQNLYSSQINNKNQSSKKVEMKKIIPVPVSNIANTVVSKNKIVVLNNDVIVSGNEINPEKIYIKKKLLGSGAFGEVWLVHHKDLDRDFAMKIIKKGKKVK